MPLPNPIQVRFYGKSGPWVVLVHGGPGAPGEMAPLAHYLRDHFRVMEPLQRVSGSVPLTVARHVSDLYDVLRDPGQQEPVRLVGFSWGAMLALTYAARYPVDIDRLVLIGCGTFDKNSRQAYETRMAQRTEADTERIIRNLRMQLSVEKDRHQRNKLFAALGAVLTRIQSFDPLASTSAGLECDEAGFSETWEDALSLQERGVQPAEFKAIQAPVTMIHGQDDPHPGSLIFESLAPFIGNIQYRELPRCGHTPWLERQAKEKFYSLLAECLAFPLPSGSGDLPGPVSA